ncbi:MAG: SMI1/KNR4 family protein [Alphaproteobacteria bacterium]|nr:SMI1/KNR4 family protein [Alphaproteobacteria bacterium]
MTEAELHDYWRAQRARVARLKARDPRRVLFGAHSDRWGHRYRVARVVPEAKLVAFEERCGRRLPLEYRTFLRSYGAGGAGPDYGIRRFQEAILPHTYPIPWGHTDTVETDGLLDDHPVWRHDGLGFLGTAGCGIDWYIELNGPQPGTVWCDGDGALYKYPPFQPWFEHWAARAEQAVAIIQAFTALKQRFDAKGGLDEAAVVEALGAPERSTRRDDGVEELWFARGGGHVLRGPDGGILDVVPPRKGCISA